jgi:hypothetical protein
MSFTFKTVIAAAAVAVAAPAMATPYNVPVINIAPGTDFGSLTVSPGRGAFIDNFLFNLPRGGRATVRVESVQTPGDPNRTNVNFNATRVRFNNVLVPRISTGVYELRVLLTSFTAAGVSNLLVQGASGALGSYTSSLTLVVPEPATWGMLIVGFGAAGVALRTRRRRTSVAATA